MTSTSDGVVVYTIREFDNPDTGFVSIQARNDGALTNSRASTEEYGVVVRAWPGDIIWETDVLDAVESGLPELAKLVGLDWIPTNDLEIVESQEVSLAGYGGWYLSSMGCIERTAMPNWPGKNPKPYESLGTKSPAAPLLS